MPTTRYTTFDGEIVSENRGGVMRDYVPDPLGSTVALLDNTQAQTDTFSYWPYGESQTRTGTTPTPFQFVGTAGYYKDNTSKAYVRARTLDAVKTRWITQDPIGLEGGDTNLYIYAANMTASIVDPSGLSPRDYSGWDKNCRKWNGSGWHSCSSPQWNACLAKCGAGNVDHCCSNGSKSGGPKSGSGFDCSCIKPPQRPRHPAPCPDYTNYPGDTLPGGTMPPGGGNSRRQKPGAGVPPKGPGQGCSYNCGGKSSFNWSTLSCTYTGCGLVPGAPAGCPVWLGALTVYGPCANLSWLPIRWS